MAEEGEGVEGRPLNVEVALLHAHLMVALCTQLAAVRDALMARLDVEWQGQPVERARESGKWADEVLAGAETYLSDVEKATWRGE